MGCGAPVLPVIINILAPRRSNLEQWLEYSVNRSSITGRRSKNQGGTLSAYFDEDFFRLKLAISARK
jgi:hypothetical protein